MYRQTSLLALCELAIPANRPSQSYQKSAVATNPFVFGLQPLRTRAITIIRETCIRRKLSRLMVLPAPCVRLKYKPKPWEGGRGILLRDPRFWVNSRIQVDLILRAPLPLVLAFRPGSPSRPVTEMLSPTGGRLESPLFDPISRHMRGVR